MIEHSAHLIKYETFSQCNLITIYGKVIGIYMGANCTALIADLSLLFHGRDFMLDTES